MSELNLINLAEVESKEVKWLWKPYLPAGKITILRGNPGEGKTMLALSIIAALTTGAPLFGEDEQREPVCCIYQSAEDGIADTIKPRLEAAGADCSKVRIIDESKSSLSFTDDRIEQAIVQTNAKLLVLDPLQAYLTGVDMHRANEVRPAFHALGTIAQRTGCAIVLIGHMNKTKGQGGLYRGLGSIDIAGAARSILLVRRLADGSDVLCLAHIKSNLAALGQTLQFTVRNNRMEYVGTCGIGADELLHGGEKGEGDLPTKVMQAIDYFEELAATRDEIPSADAYRLFAQKGFSQKTVENAKRELGLPSVKRGKLWNFDLRSLRE